VQTLTLVPTLIDGRIEWEDSPLVRAAKTGRTLIVDEADNAPLDVVCVLKGLIEDGEMLLVRPSVPSKAELQSYSVWDRLFLAGKWQALD
jgi:midasin (ATPase involved in ribosome maturation)